HTLYRPRDLMYIGGEIAKIDPSRRGVREILDAVDAATKRIVESIFAEMRPFFSVPVRDKLFPLIRTNVLKIQDLEEAGTKYLRELSDGSVRPIDDDAHHPFAILYE